MASIIVKFRPSKVDGREGSIYFQILHQRRVRQLVTDYHIFPREWNPANASVIVGNDINRNEYLASIRDNVRQDLERFKKIIRHFEDSGFSYKSEDIIKEYLRFVNEFSLFNYMSKIISQFKNNDKLRTSETYQTTLNSFRKFRNDMDIHIDCIDSDLMEQYQAWNVTNGVTQNTISFYNRILRAVYNRAVEENITEDRHPFRHVYTGVDKTRKRALPLKTIRKINSLDLAYNPSLDFARDIFMLSFMLRGMSFIDMAFLKKSDLFKQRLSYRRRKTGQLLHIEWTKEMQKIVDKYPSNTTSYLLPIITKSGINERCAYKHLGYVINYNLKKIASKLKLPVNLSLYVARHSWASIANSNGIPVSVISEGLGHDNEQTTRIYLANLDTAVVDKANHRILTLL